MDNSGTADSGHISRDNVPIHQIEVIKETKEIDEESQRVMPISPSNSANILSQIESHF
jgi:hypothetical protein